MVQNSALEVAISLMLMYLTLSLLCTVINEFIATKLQLRASSLASALEQLLDNKPLRDAFYQHGLIAGAKKAVTTGSQSTFSATAAGAAAVIRTVKTMFVAPTVGVATGTSVTNESDRDNHPSYLSGKTVALALIGSLETGKAVPGFADIEAAVTALPESNLRDALLASLTESGGNVDSLRTSIATWFDDSMDRLSGAYKRQLKWISMVIGLIVAVTFNADTVKVATTLWSDPIRRALVLDEVSAITKADLPPDGQPVDLGKLRDGVTTAEQTLWVLPIGWRCDGAPTHWRWDKECAATGASALTLLQLFGLLLTAAALTLGAPFWFDLLGKFINLRGAGPKPQREDGKPA